MRHLRANTEVDVVCGPFVDVGDGFTPETGVTLGSADEAELMKHDAGTASVTSISAATWAAITGMDGYYNLTLTAALTDTEGMLVIAIQDDDVCLPVRHEFMVMAEAAYDSLYVAKDVGFMDVNIKTVGRADAQETEANNLESACSNYSAARGLTGTAVPDAAADAAGGLMISDDGGWDADELYDAIITDAVGANIAVDIATAQSDLDTLTGSDGATLATAQGNYAPSKAGDLMGLADNAITSSKYDESTAYPVKSDDSATTQIARVGADGDTLETLSDQIDGAATVAEVNAQVSDVLKTDTISEMSQGIPPTTPTFEEAVMYLYMALTKKIDVDAALKEFYNNAGTVIWKKALADDASNYNEDKGQSGP